MQLTILLTTIAASAALATTQYQCTSPDVLQCCQDFVGGALNAGTATGVDCSSPTDEKSLQGPGSCPAGSLSACCGIAIVRSQSMPGEFANCKEPTPA